MKKLKKSPIWAAIINFILPGLGYVYGGKKKILGIAIFSALVIGLVDLFLTSTAPTNSILGWASTIILLGALAYDAYKETK